MATPSSMESGPPRVPPERPRFLRERMILQLAETYRWQDVPTRPLPPTPPSMVEPRPNETSPRTEQREESEPASSAPANVKTVVVSAKTESPERRSPTRADSRSSAQVEDQCTDADGVSGAADEKESTAPLLTRPVRRPYPRHWIQSGLRLIPERVAAADISDDTDDGSANDSGLGNVLASIQSSIKLFVQSDARKPSSGQYNIFSEPTERLDTRRGKELTYRPYFEQLLFEEDPRDAELALHALKECRPNTPEGRERYDNAIRLLIRIAMAKYAVDMSGFQAERFMNSVSKFLLSSESPSDAHSRAFDFIANFSIHIVFCSRNEHHCSRLIQSSVYVLQEALQSLLSNRAATDEGWYAALHCVLLVSGFLRERNSSATPVIAIVASRSKEASHSKSHILRLSLAVVVQFAMRFGGRSTSTERVLVGDWFCVGACPDVLSDDWNPAGVDLSCLDSVGGVHVVSWLYMLSRSYTARRRLFRLLLAYAVTFASERQQEDKIKEQSRLLLRVLETHSAGEALSPAFWRCPDSLVLKIVRLTIMKPPTTGTAEEYSENAELLSHAASVLDKRFVLTVLSKFENLAKQFCDDRRPWRGVGRHQLPRMAISAVSGCLAIYDGADNRGASETVGSAFRSLQETLPSGDLSKQLELQRGTLLLAETLLGSVLRPVRRRSRMSNHEADAELDGFFGLEYELDVCALSSVNATLISQLAEALGAPLYNVGMLRDVGLAEYGFVSLVRQALVIALGQLDCALCRPFSTDGDREVARRASKFVLFAAEDGRLLSPSDASRGPCNNPDFARRVLHEAQQHDDPRVLSDTAWQAALLESV